jgi:hypothetical protein
LLAARRGRLAEAQIEGGRSSARHITVETDPGKSI